MDEPAWFAVATLLGGAIAVVIRYAALRFLNNGDVNRSTAGKLWEEATSIRRQLQEDVHQLRKELNSVREELLLKEKAVYELQAKLMVAEKREAELEYQVDELKMKLAAAEAREQTLRAEMADLRAKAEGALG